jgi:hypothetical protein
VKQPLLRTWSALGLCSACLAAAPLIAAPKKSQPTGKPVAKPAAKPAPKAPAKPAPKPAPPMAFTPAELDLAPGETYLAELVVPSPTGKAFTSKLTYTPGTGLTVKPDARWTGKVPPWGVKSYPRITASADATGDVPVEVALEGGGKAILTVHVLTPTVEMVPGLGQLTVKVTNPFRTRAFNGRVQVSNPDRFLQDVTTREFKLPAGETGELVFPLPGAAPAESEQYEFTVKLDGYHGYKFRKTEALTFPPQPQKDPLP